MPVLGLADQIHLLRKNLMLAMPKVVVGTH